MTKNKSVILWAMSIILMAGVVVYQKTTGPTYPKKGDKEIYGINIDYSLPRSNDGAYTVKVLILDESRTLHGKYKIKRFKSHDDWSEYELQRNGDSLSFIIPHQSAAGKVMYQIFLTIGDKPIIVLNKNPVVLRFRNNVPGVVVIFHLIFIFATITLSVRTGFEAFFRGNKVKIFTILTLLSLILGGFVFGPLMQKFAFGAYWTGWPMKGLFNIADLTDTKTFVALMFWLIALWATYKKPEGRKWQIAASIVLIIVYMIPHSLLGSEIDYTKIEKKKIEQISE
ncbi:MAG: hypothetical protein V1779_06170 [bacterium]